MQGAIIKSYYAEKKGIDPKDIFVVSIIPCTAKKDEAQREQLNVDGLRDVDAVLTTREQTERGKPIYPMSRLESFCQRYKIRIGIIAVPTEFAQDVCDVLIDCGVEAIWNFAPVRLRMPEHVTVKNENLALSLTSLRMQLKRQEKRVSCK